MSEFQPVRARHAHALEANPPQVIGTVLGEVGIRSGGPGPDQGGWCLHSRAWWCQHKASGSWIQPNENPIVTVYYLASK